MKKTYTEEIMEPEKIIELNKTIRQYDGENSFILSLQRNLKTSKIYLEHNSRKFKRLSDKQYGALVNILEK